MIKAFPIWFVRLSGVNFDPFEELRLSGFRFKVGLWFSFIRIMWIYVIQRLFAGVLDILNVWQSPIEAKDLLHPFGLSCQLFRSEIVIENDDLGFGLLIGKPFLPCLAV